MVTAFTRQVGVNRVLVRTGTPVGGTFMSSASIS
jgi:hypothetical protein